jgi:hypothetical protein
MSGVLRPGSRTARVLGFFGLASPDARSAPKQDMARGALLGGLPIIVAAVVTSLLNVHGLLSLVVWVGVAIVASIVWWPLLTRIWPPSG